MMITHLKNMFAYDTWANSAVIKALSVDDQKSLDLMMHIQAAKHVWLSEITNRKREIAAFPVGNIDQIKYWELKNNTDFELWFDGVNAEELDREVDSINHERRKYASKIVDIMQQLINHGTYHRAQIALHMKQKSLTPVPTDYLLYNQWISNQ